MRAATTCGVGFALYLKWVPHNFHICVTECSIHLKWGSTYRPVGSKCVFFISNGGRHTPLSPLPFGTMIPQTTLFSLVPDHSANGPKISRFDAGSNWIKWSHFLQRFFGIRCTIAAGDWGLGPKRAALAGPPAAMVQRIPRNPCRKSDPFSLVWL